MVACENRGAALIREEEVGVKRKRHSIYLFFSLFWYYWPTNEGSVTIQCGQKSKDFAPLRNRPTQTAAPLFFILDVCGLL